ncbi:hypothetical protein RN001_010566 [Aquatica leii]|uniref:E3 ubiquitin-protein ligase CHFR n=1 Tax=Aquatica leii TaxID=1421715 RepID=A0AAN7Q3D6_9COLE|nr:hypothetical protein RN001_010566 [Aquatica leii]
MKQAVLVPQSKDTSIPKIQLTNEKFLIGRGLQNNQVIEDVNISRSHCIFIHKDGCWYLLDKSSNGTWLNGNLLDKTKEYMLLHGDVIALGNNVKFEYQICSDDDSRNSQIAGEKNTEAAAVNDNLKTGVYVGKLNGNVLPQLDLENTTNLSKMSATNKETDEKLSTDIKLSGLTYAEDELQCSICTEMFIKAVTLSCSHTFCKYCITQWRKNQTICPICRADIKMEFSTLVLDNFISKIVEKASDELKEHRDNLIKEREVASTATPGPSGNRRRRPATDPIEISSSESSSDHEDDDDDDEEPDYLATFGFSYSDNEDDDYDEDDDWSYNYDYNGLPGHYYGGYGKCYSCGQRGHWSNGCPTKRRR